MTGDAEIRRKSNQTQEALMTVLATNLDKEFESLIQYIEERNFLQVTEVIKQNLRYFNSSNTQVYKNSMNFNNEHKLWGIYDPQNNNYELAENRAKALVEHRKDFEWIYHNLKDYRSKRIMVSILYYWLMSDPKKIEQIYDRTFDQYFDLDLVKCSKNEVFVDLGGYVGDTFINYTKVFGNDCYKKIYCYEIVPANIEYIKSNINILNLENVEIKAKGASSKNDIMYISTNELSSVSQLSDNGTHAVPIVRIDDDIEGEVTFIKMDIEGGEEDALLGCLGKIKEYHPKLALSVYHNHKDLWKLAQIIYDTDQSYNFYLRYYGSPIFPTEFILYAI